MRLSLRKLRGIPHDDPARVRARQSLYETSFSIRYIKQALMLAFFLYACSLRGFAEQSTESSSSLTTTNQQEGSTASRFHAASDSPVARQALASLLRPYKRNTADDWNITLHAAVTEQNGSHLDELICVIGAAYVTRSYTRDGQQIRTTITHDEGTVETGGVKEDIPLWSAQSSLLSEFPYAQLLDRLQDPDTYINSVVKDDADAALIHLRMTKANIDSNGRHVIEAEKMYAVDLFFDSETGLLVKQQHWIFSRSSMSNNAVVEVIYADYRSVDGLMVPFHVTKKIGGLTLSDALIRSVDLRASNVASGSEAVR
jgi:hypothetical protein